MADLILACSRPGRPAIAAERLRRAALRLAPPEVPLREPLVLETAGVVVAVANPTDEGVILHGDAGEPGDEAPGGGVCVGGLFGDRSSWWRLGTDVPDGTYALARWDAHSIELVSDICASRTLWYARTEEALLASTSQRALVILLGSFELLPEATACFLSSGTLGPEVAWDARLRRLPPDTRAVHDRATWGTVLHETPLELNATACDPAADVARLNDAITATCGSLGLDLDHWVLPLSGGHDSRALLAYLVKNGLRPRCVTWTTHRSLRNPLSDVSLARVLARRYHVDHELFYLDESDADLETMLARFVAANEGRNDEIAGYLDGLALWRDLALSGVQGIIRGDESFGPLSRPMQPEAGRRQVGGATPDDYPEGHLLRGLDLAPQSWPRRLQQLPHEGRRDYRLRLSQQGYIPIILAGLNEPKARYLEIVNPHLSRCVIGAVRSLSPESRSHARAFRRLADGLDPFVPYARASSTLTVPDLLAGQDMVALLVSELVSPEIRRVLPDDGSVRMLTAMSATSRERRGARAGIRALVKAASSALPTRLAVELAPAWKGPEPLSPAKLALRATIAGRTIALFEEDAAAV